jgi:hypothetical protein
MSHSITNLYIWKEPGNDEQTQIPGVFQSSAYLNDTLGVNKRGRIKIQPYLIRYSMKNQTYEELEDAAVASLGVNPETRFFLLLRQSPVM